MEMNRKNLNCMGTEMSKGRTGVCPALLPVSVLFFGGVVFRGLFWGGFGGVFFAGGLVFFWFC